MNQDRRTLLSAIGLAFPFGRALRPAGSAAPAGPPLVLRFRSFEDAVREAFATTGAPAVDAGRPFPCRRVEVGHSEAIEAGVQGCHNVRPFAGFPAGHLRIVRAGSEPGPVRGGVRLYVTTVDVALTRGRDCGGPSRPLDFAALPPAPVLAIGKPTPADGAFGGAGEASRPPDPPGDLHPNPLLRKVGPLKN